MPRPPDARQGLRTVPLNREESQCKRGLRVPRPLEAPQNAHRRGHQGARLVQIPTRTSRGRPILVRFRDPNPWKPRKCAPAGRGLRVDSRVAEAPVPIGAPRPHLATIRHRRRVVLCRRHARHTALRQPRHLPRHDGGALPTVHVEFRVPCGWHSGLRASGRCGCGGRA